MRLPGYKRLRQSARWLRSRLWSEGLILGYHRIAEDDNDLYANCVRPYHFAEHLAVLRKVAHPISLGEFIESREHGVPLDRAVVVTFDDGYADNLYAALPELIDNDVPAAVFIATGFSGSEFWWDELARILLFPGTFPEVLEVEVGSRTFHWDNEDVGSAVRRTTVNAVYLTLLRLSVDHRRSAMDQLRAQTGAAPVPDSHACRALELDELRALAGSDLITIGAHSVNHPMLALLPPDIQEWEINASRCHLEMVLDRPVAEFSYPNGSASNITRTLVEQAGYRTACTSYSDVVYAGSDRLFLPRFWVPDVDGSTFERWLQRWLV